MTTKINYRGQEITKESEHRFFVNRFNVPIKSNVMFTHEWRAERYIDEHLKQGHRRNTTKIRLTKVDEKRIGWSGANLERFMATTLWLRTARKAGDEEVVNNFMLSALNYAKGLGMIDFEKIQ